MQYSLKYLSGTGIALFVALILSFLFLATPISLDRSAYAETTGLSDPTTFEVEPRLTRPSEVKFGSLLLESAQSGSYIEAPLEASDVEINVSGLIARTKFTQKFHNPSQDWVEALYVFPMPDEAAVDTLKMQIGDRFIEAQVKERKEAKKIYEQAKTEGKKASLLEQERPNIFTNSVANIGPGETVIIQIEYQEALLLENGEVNLRFPMVVAPRFIPAPEVKLVSLDERGFAFVNEAVPDQTRITPPVLDPAALPAELVHNPISLRVNIEAGFAIDKIKSPYHPIDIDRPNPSSAHLKLSEGHVPANKDFSLTWTAKPGNRPSAALFKETWHGEDYVLAMITPPIRPSDLEIHPRESIYVIDTSGSMAGASMPQAKASLMLALSRLNPGDSFNVIQFASGMDQVFPSPVSASPANIDTAVRYVKNLSANGGTNMLPALNQALRDNNPKDNTSLRQVIFLTDGAIGNESQLFEVIGSSLGRSRLFTVGIGSAPNSYFMTRAARLGRGTFTHIGDLNEVAVQMTELFEKLESPVATDLTLLWPKGSQVQSWPNPLPDLYSGQPVMVAAKMPSAKGQMILKGQLNGAEWATALDLKDASAGTGISKLWARKKIASIEESRYDGTPMPEVNQMVLSTALNYHLVSRLTSLVAVDVTPSRPHDQALKSTQVPLNLPGGWDFEKVFGSSGHLIRQIKEHDTQHIQEGLLKASVSPAPKSTQGVNLPRGSTLSNLYMMFGATLLLISTFLWLLRQKSWRV